MLDNDAYEAAVTLAKTFGMRLGEVISQLIRRAIQVPERRPQKSRRRLPTFDVSPWHSNDFSARPAARMGRR